MITGDSLESHGVVASPGAGDVSGAERALETLVVAEQVRGLYARAALPFLTVIVNSSILAFVLWGRGDSTRITVWVSLVYAICLGRLVLWWSYRRRSPGPEEARRWGWLFTVGSGLNGIAWGASAFALYPPGDVVMQAVILLVLGGMTAGSATSAATFAPAFAAYAVPALAPIAGRLLAEGDRVHGALGAMAALFGFAMSRIARAGGQMLIDSERLRYKNAALVDDLREVRAHLTTANQDLEQRVTERTSELVATLGQQKVTEEALRRQKEVLQKVFDYSPVLFILYGPDGKVELINRELERVLGYVLDDYQSERHRFDIIPDAVERAAALLRQRAGSLAWREVVCRTKDGRSLHTSWANALLSDGMVIGIGQDVTESRKARDALILSARMASVGTLAAGVAHEINNPLAFVISNLEFTTTALRASLYELSRHPDLEIAAHLCQALDAVGDASTGALRVRNIVRDLKTFSRGVDDSGAPADLIEVLETSIRMAANELRHRARVVREFGAVPSVGGHGDRLGQVFLNLLVNAAQAIPEGDASQNEVRVVARTDGSGRAVVEIRDTGCGIAPEVLPRILDPFFTTKPVGQGTGLGLSICHGIVSGLGGEIEVESELGKGSVFRVLLPAVRRDDSPPAARRPFEVDVRRVRILVVDDEPMFGKAVERMVGADHHVVCETRARQALSRIAGGESFDVILCDLMMPDVTGMEFVEQLSSINRLLASRVVLTTGGAFTDRAREFLERTPHPRLSKPFAKQELDEVLCAILRGESK